MPTEPQSQLIYVQICDLVLIIHDLMNLVTHGERR